MTTRGQFGERIARFAVRALIEQIRNHHAKAHKRNIHHRVTLTALACATIRTLLTTGSARFDKTDAKRIFQATPDYLGALASFAFEFDSSLDIVTDDNQKLAIVSSRMASLDRSGQLHAIREGGFANIELGFGGQVMTILNRDANHYAEIQAAGNIDELINTLRTTYGQPLPAADLLSTDVARTLMPLFTDVKDLGSGVIGGVECDHLAFRTEEVDLQIWIAQGPAPYPCRYAITDTSIAGFPEYRVTITGWHVDAGPLAMELPQGASEVEAGALPDVNGLAGPYSIKGE